MRPFYTIAAGEFVTASRLLKEVQKITVWFPAKDDGSVLLLHCRATKKTCSIQVKTSRDYKDEFAPRRLQPHLKSFGSFAPTRKRIKKSRSDFWVLVLH